MSRAAGSFALPLNGFFSLPCRAYLKRESQIALRLLDRSEAFCPFLGADRPTKGWPASVGAYPVASGGGFSAFMALQPCMPAGLHHYDNLTRLVAKRVVLIWII